MRAFGLDRGLPFPLSDLAEADCVVLVGSNLAETMPPVMQHLSRQHAAGGSLVVVDPRRTPTAAAADLHLQVQPGTDLALANGLLFLAIDEGLVDEAYVTSRTTGWEDVRRTVAAYWPARAERLTGVSEPDLRAAVCQHTLVVLPFVSGGGIKNKLLEGAALGRPIICTPHACKSLQHDGVLPMVLATSARDWVERVIRLWSDERQCAELGREARRWVSQYYSWSSPAGAALQAFERGLAARGKHQTEGSEEIPVTDL